MQHSPIHGRHRGELDGPPPQKQVAFRRKPQDPPLLVTLEEVLDLEQVVLDGEKLDLAFRDRDQLALAVDRLVFEFP